MTPIPQKKMAPLPEREDYVFADELVLDGHTFDELSKAIENAPAPTAALVELFRK